MIYNSNISKVHFSISGSDLSKRGSIPEIKSKETLSNGVPKPGGLYDKRLGTTDNLYNCDTCFKDKQNCIGHDGYYKLNYPIWNPLLYKEVIKWLKMVCFNCGKLITSKTDDLTISNLTKPKSRGIKLCPHCNAEKGTIKYDKIGIYNVIGDRKEVINSHNALNIFNKISYDTIKLLHMPEQSHPKNYIITYLVIPSIAMRPEVKRIGSNKINHDTITSALITIIDINTSIPPSIYETNQTITDNQMQIKISNINSLYKDIINSKDESVVSSIKSRITGKTGLIRNNLIGKKCHLMGRNTIAGDPTLKINELGLPIYFAKILYVEEVVQPRNMKRLQNYCFNGTKKYPGAGKIIKKNGSEYSTDSERKIVLEVGDTVLRDLIDGDYILFNRAPSLMISNISCHVVKVIHNPNVRTFMMNVIACPLYHADFDGDQMHAIALSRVEARNEISQCSAVSNWIVSISNSGPQIGQVDDSIIGLYELTQAKIRYDKYHANLLFGTTIMFPNVSELYEENKLSGKDIVSLTMKKCPINYDRDTNWYQESLIPFVKYNDDNKKLVIKGGIIEKGVLDAKSISKSAKGGLYHLINNDYNNNADNNNTLMVMHDMQQLAIKHIYQAGFSIGINDILVDKATKKEINRINDTILYDSRLTTEQFNTGKMISPIGMSMEDFYERTQINKLSIIDDFKSVILSSIDTENNNLFKLINTGSKGKLPNMFNIVSCIGQIQINSARIAQNFGYKRTLPYFKRFDSTPESRGYINNSYVSGMTVPEFIFNAMSSRFDLIANVLYTSVTGEQSRKSIKSLESIICNNFRQSVKNRNIIQNIYGDDYIDARKIEAVDIKTVNMSDKELEKNYLHKYKKYYEIVKQDRDMYRQLYIKMESITMSLMSNKRQTIHVNRIIDNVLFEDRQRQKGEVEESLLKLIVEYCDNIPYIALNSIQEAKKTKIPESIKQAFWILRMAIMSHLSPVKLKQEEVHESSIRIIFNKIKLHYMKSMIEPGTAIGIISAQSFSEPFTQYMLDSKHRSASGGTSKKSMTHSKEILSVKNAKLLIDPKMILHLIDYKNKENAQNISNNIETIKVSQFVKSWQIFFEKIGEPVHSKYVHEKAIIEKFLKLNPSINNIVTSSNLLRWVVRLELKGVDLILKGITVDYIVEKLYLNYTDIIVVYTTEIQNNTAIFIRIYFKNTIVKGSSVQKFIEELLKKILNTTIRGIEDITNSEVSEIKRTMVADDGSLINSSEYIVRTEGINIKDILFHDGIDHYRVVSSSIQETFLIFGIEAARSMIISNLKFLLDSISVRHYLMYADEMTYTGIATGIDSTGLKIREKNNILLRIGFASPMITLQEASLYAITDQVTGVTSSLILGNVPQTGTLYNTFQVNEQFIKENVKSNESFIDDLF